MLLALDIGNTNIVLGVFDGSTLAADFRLHTEARATGDELGLLVRGLLRGRGIDPSVVERVVVSSVVPALTRAVDEMSRQGFDTAPLIVGPGVRTGMRILAEDPRQVGADRIVNSLAAFHTYGGPAIVVDLGTATNFDCITADGAYLGGAIAPGMLTSLDALVSHTAKLNRIDAVVPPSVIGRNTTTAMQSGLVFGYAGMIEGLVGRMRAELGDNTTVIATGGLAELIAACAPCIDHVDQRLTLDGLRLVAELNVGSPPE